MFWNLISNLVWFGFKYNSQIVFLSLRVFRLLSSSLLLFPQCTADIFSSLLQVFVELGNLHGTSNYVLYWIPGGRLFWFYEGSQVRQTPEEGQRTYWPKSCRNNYKDEDNSPKTLNDKNHQASSLKFRLYCCMKGRYILIYVR